MTPFFSFGVTTYNRKDLLKECINSILSQSFDDFEVIISNDYVEEKIELSELDIFDSRVRIINQETNLGPWKNHNYTLEKSLGKYFSWLSDDDLISSDYLEVMYDAIISHNEPERIFSGYKTGGSSSDFYSNESIPYKTTVMSGENFLYKYLSREINTIGHYGVFKTSYLKELGGLENLGAGIYSPYNDNLLAIKSGLLEQVIYINIPLVFFRTHEESSSISVSNIVEFSSAQSDFLNKAMIVINNKKLNAHKNINTFHLVLWCLNNLFSVLARSSQFLPQGIIKALLLLESYSRKSGWNYIKFLRSIFIYTLRYIKYYFINKVSKIKK